MRQLTYWTSWWIFLWRRMDANRTKRKLINGLACLRFWRLKTSRSATNPRQKKSMLLQFLPLWNKYFTSFYLCKISYFNFRIRSKYRICYIIFNIRAWLIVINNIWITIDHDFDPVAPGESVNSGKNELTNGTDHRWNSRIASVTISNCLVVKIFGIYIQIAISAY